MSSLRISGAALLVAAALPLAACGSASTNTDTSASLSSAAKQAIGLRFAQCMRASGVPSFPDPGSNGHGGIAIQARERAGSGPSLSVNGVSVAAPQFQSAMQACRKYLPNGGRPTAAQTARAKAQALAMARCMRTHGVPNFPDPQFRTGPGGGGGVFFGGGPGQIDRNSPAFQAAQKICMPLFGKGTDVQAPAP